MTIDTAHIDRVLTDIHSDKQYTDSCRKEFTLMFTKLDVWSYRKRNLNWHPADNHSKKVGNT